MKAPSPPVPTTVENRFSVLEEEGAGPSKPEVEDPDPRSGSPPPKKAKTRKKTNKSPPAKEREKKEEGPEIKLLERPHKPTWFLPGRVGREPVQILMDTGCTTNLMSKAVFDRLDKTTRESVEPCETFGTLADGGSSDYMA